ncbi:MAG: hypothetical protein MHM6MM_005262 [Cercozoa sp. M6MM]
MSRDPEVGDAANALGEDEEDNGAIERQETMGSFRGCCGLGWPRSRVTRVLYTVYFVATMIWAYAMRTWGDSVWQPDDECGEDCVGVIAVYRVAMATVVFHAVLLLVVFGVNSSSNPRARFQNRLWLPKFLILVGLVAGFSFVPAKMLNKFGTAAIVFGVVWILVQTLLLVAITHDIAESWLDKWQDGNTRYRNLVILCSLVFLGFCVGSSAWLLSNRTSGTGCRKNTVFVVVNLCLSLLNLLLSVSPVVQTHNSRSGLLQSTMIAAYTTYLVLSAIASEPVNDEMQCRESDDNSALAQVARWVGVLFTMLAITRAIFATTGKITRSGEDDASTQRMEDGLVVVEVDDEKDHVEYSYSFFHFVFVCAAFYTAAVFTNWVTTVSSDSNDTIEVDQGMGAVWAKMGASWGVHVLYAWTLLAPVLFPDRDFS